MAINFDIKDPKNQKLIATFLIPVVILYAFFHFVIKPKMEEVKTKKTELVNLQVELNSIQKKITAKKRTRGNKEESYGKTCGT